jgi:hypothetical protein
VDMQKTGCWRGGVAQWGLRVTGDFGALAGLTSTYPGVQSFRFATSFAVRLVPGCDRLWTDWNTCSRRGAGTFG